MENGFYFNEHRAVVEIKDDTIRLVTTHKQLPLQDLDKEGLIPATIEDALTFIVIVGKEVWDLKAFRLLYNLNVSAVDVHMSLTDENFFNIINNAKIIVYENSYLKIRQ